MILHSKYLSLTCIHKNRRIFFHEITADLFDIKSTSLTKVITHWFCGPQSSKQYEHIYIYMHIQLFEDLFQNTCLALCLVSPCVWFLVNFLVVAPSSLVEQGGGSPQPSMDSVLCFAAGGSTGKSPTSDAGNARATLRSNYQHAGTMESLVPWLQETLGPFWCPGICCVSHVRDHAWDLLHTALNSCHLDFT